MKCRAVSIVSAADALMSGKMFDAYPGNFQRERRIAVQMVTPRMVFFYPWNAA
jgi:hypothetical protein